MLSFRDTIHTLLVRRMMRLSVCNQIPGDAVPFFFFRVSHPLRMSSCSIEMPNVWYVCMSDGVCVFGTRDHSRKHLSGRLMAKMSPIQSHACDERADGIESFSSKGTVQKIFN